MQIQDHRYYNAVKPFHPVRDMDPFGAHVCFFLEPFEFLYIDIKDYDNLSQCRHLYYGDIHYSDSFVNLVMQNQDNESERVFLNIINTFGRGSLTVGMLSGTSSKYMVPMALKVVISHVRIEENEDLLEALRFSREDFSLMKRAYCFTVDRMFELLDT